MALPKWMLCILLLGVVSQQIRATVLKNKSSDEEIIKDTRENDVVESDIDEDEKSQVYSLHDSKVTTKKAGVIENIVNKISSIKPITIHNPLKKPLQDLQEYLKPKPAPVVTRTKTIKLEVTKMITKHPICVASVQRKPACSVINHNAISYKDDSEKLNRDSVAEKVEELLSEVAPKIKPSAAVKMPEDISTPLYESESEAEVRSGRFLRFNNQATPAIDEVKSVINEAEIDGASEIEDNTDEARFLFKKGETKYVTRTLWATKVQTVTDYKVTATLVPENCVPLDLYFPQCSVPQKKPLLWKEEDGKNETHEEDKN